MPYHGIEACNEVMNGYSHIIAPALKHECLCMRAALLLKVLLTMTEPGLSIFVFPFSLDFYL